MPLGGFGNLMALPSQGAVRKAGNSVFVDASLHPYDDQWAFLATLLRNPACVVFRIASEAEAFERTLGVRLLVDGKCADEPWKLLSLRQAIAFVVADQVYPDRTAPPPAMVAQSIRLAAFHHPEFYRVQAMRFPTFDKPRIISCAELHPRHVALPRGCLDELTALARNHGTEVVLEDRCQSGELLLGKASFLGELQLA